MLAKKFALGFGIAIIFPMMIHYGVSTFVHEPKWNDFRSGYYSYDYDAYKNATPAEKAKMDAERRQREDQRRAAEKRFQRALFFVATPLGLAAIVVGSLLPIQAIGTGLMFGGIFSVCEGYISYWSELPDGMRFISLLGAFIILVYIGYRKLAK